MTLSALLTHIAFACAILLLSAGVTYLMASVVRLMDVPNERSSHDRPVAKSGGLAIVLAFTAGNLVIYFGADVARVADRHFWGFLLSAVLLAGVSFVDDITQRSFKSKVLAQVLCAGVLLASGVTLTKLYIPLAGETSLGGWGYVLTFLWIIGLTNAYNFMDGLDGLAGGVAVIAAGFLCAIALRHDSNFVYLTSYVLIASVAGFLIFNLPPARIFMGDVGSAFIGFAFAALAVIGANLDFGHLPFYVVPLLFFHFIFDTFFTFVRRLLRREPVHLAHRTHLYQLLNRLGYSHWTVSLYHYAVTAAQGIGAYLFVRFDPRERAIVFVPYLVYQVCYAWWVLRRAKTRGLL